MVYIPFYITEYFAVLLRYIYLSNTAYISSRCCPHRWGSHLPFVRPGRSQGDRHLGDWSHPTGRRTRSRCAYRHREQPDAKIQTPRFRARV